MNNDDINNFNEKDEIDYQINQQIEIDENINEENEVLCYIVLLKKPPKTFIKKNFSPRGFVPQSLYSPIVLNKSTSNISLKSNGSQKNMSPRPKNIFIKKNSISNIQNEINDTKEEENILHYSEEIVEKKNIENENTENENTDLFEQINKFQIKTTKKNIKLSKKNILKINKKKKKEQIEEEEEDNDIYQNNHKKNQLFRTLPSKEFINEMMEMFLGKNNIHSYYQFSRKTLEQKNIIEKINLKINELKQYYLKCKHKKYLENLDIKKCITIFRQMIKLENYQLKSMEKYQNGKKYLLYHIEIENGEKIEQIRKNSFSTEENGNDFEIHFS
jgi:hypothetical protein